MKILIVGRANVGKSSLFNRITKSRKALVLNEPGITRDILAAKASWQDKEFEILDSGGLPARSENRGLLKKVHEKLLVSIEEADAFIFVTDGKAGLQPGDVEMLKLIRKTNKPYEMFVNKIDSPSQAGPRTADFYELMPRFLHGSFEKNQGVDQILSWILTLDIPASKPKDASDQQERTKLFVIGRANSGKSLLCNQVLKKNRMIVSPERGTTLDTVESFFKRSTTEFSISDNPGIQKRDAEDKDKLSFAKSRSELEKTQIALLLMDGTTAPSRQDSKLLELCLKKNKPVILVVNKIDKIENFRKNLKDLEEKIKQTFRFFSDLPIVYISAKTGQNISKLFKTIQDISRKSQRKIPTSQLNNFFTKVIRKAPAPTYGTSDVKFFYITQTSRIPPSFLAFANYPKGVTPFYKKFVVNQIKKEWGLGGVPIQLTVLSRR